MDFLRPYENSLTFVSESLLKLKKPPFSGENPTVITKSPPIRF
jgi:hypothetical protein